MLQKWPKLGNGQAAKLQANLNHRQGKTNLIFQQAIANCIPADETLIAAIPPDNGMEYCCSLPLALLRAHMEVIMPFPKP